jgi:NO-binding membrane sensor protein with MHYT domain
MHYSASFRLPFLDVSYTAVTVVFALVLACVAATAALFLFFRLRAQWQDSFWKRCICALFLATAVCG